VGFSVFVPVWRFAADKLGMLRQEQAGFGGNPKRKIESTLASISELIGPEWV
jgi:hypothetical protein